MTSLDHEARRNWIFVRQQLCSYRPWSNKLNIMNYFRESSPKIFTYVNASYNQSFKNPTTNNSCVRTHYLQ